jgi:hypothetical protein
MHGHADRDRRDLVERCLHVVAKIRLREHDDGVGTALPAECQVPLEPADVQVAVEPGRQKDHVNVRGDDLLDRLAVVVRRHPRELRPPRQHGLDHGGLGRRDGHPVADRGQVAPLLGRMAKPARELGRAFPARGVDDVGTPVLDGDARGLEAVGGMRGEFIFEGWSPAE